MQDPLRTSKGVTKQEMIEWLKSSDTPDNAELYIGHDEDTDEICLYFGWSFMSGAFGDDFVRFSKAESDMLLKEISDDRKSVDSQK